MTLRPMAIIAVPIMPFASPGCERQGSPASSGANSASAASTLACQSAGSWLALAARLVTRVGSMTGSVTAVIVYTLYDYL